MSDSPRKPEHGRSPVASHGRLKSPHPIAQIAKLLAVAVVVVLVSVVGVSAYALVDTEQTLSATSIKLEGEKALPPTIGEIEGGANILLVGTDSCQGQDVRIFPRCAHDSGGERNDVTMLIHISDNPRRITVVSFARDMLVPIPSCPDGKGGHYSAMSQQMLNASYSYGGLACTVLTVEKLTGAEVQYAAAIRWTGVIHMSDAIGGVSVCVTGDINDGNTGLHLKAGTHVLKGAAALQFLRIRHGIGDGSDLGRISNQQQFMSSLTRKLQGGGVLSNPTTLFTLATTAMTQVQEKQLVLSQSLANPTQMVQIAMAAKSVPYKDFVFVQYPTYYAHGANASRVLPVTYAGDVLFKALAENKALQLTGQASQGLAEQVKGTVSQPIPSASATPGSTASPTPSSTTNDPADTVKLPSVIAGTTAAQVTCTVPQR